MTKGAALLFLLNALWISSGYSQEQDSVETASSETAVYDFLLVSGQYQTRTTFMGRDFGQKTPFFSTDVMYWHHLGVYLTASLSKFFIEDLSWQKGFGLGFAGQFSKKADFDFSVSEFWGASYLNASGTDNIGVVQGTVGLDWGLLYSTTQFQYLINDPADFFIVSNHSRYFELDKRLWEKAVLSFEPRLSFFFGTSNYYQIGGYDLSWREFLETDDFKIQSVELAVPVNLTAGRFEFQLEPKWVIPVNVPDYDASTANIQAALKVTYALPIKKSK
jgi:hypothetical protein